MATLARAHPGPANLLSILDFIPQCEFLGPSPLPACSEAAPGTLTSAGPWIPPPVRPPLCWESALRSPRWCHWVSDPAAERSRQIVSIAGPLQIPDLPPPGKLGQGGRPRQGRARSGEPRTILMPKNSRHGGRGRGKPGSCRALGALAETGSGTAPSRLAGSSQTLGRLSCPRICLYKLR